MRALTSVSAQYYSLCDINLFSFFGPPSAKQLGSIADADERLAVDVDKLTDRLSSLLPTFAKPMVRIFFFFSFCFLF